MAHNKQTPAHIFSTHVSVRKKHKCARQREQHQADGNGGDKAGAARSLPRFGWHSGFHFLTLL
jgi:hypothetical protein